jgi:hypothetical protein
MARIASGQVVAPAQGIWPGMPEFSIQHSGKGGRQNAERGVNKGERAKPPQATPEPPMRLRFAPGWRAETGSSRRIGAIRRASTQPSAGSRPATRMRPPPSPSSTTLITSVFTSGQHI